MTTTMFMMTSVGIAAVLGLLAWLAERGLRAAGRPARWVWASAMGLTLAVPFLPRLVAARAIAPGMETGSALSAGAIADLLTALPAAGVSAWADGLLTGSWVILSVFAALTALTAVVRLIRARRRWAEAEVQDVRVRLSHRFGPAVVGLIRPTIVLPRAALDLHAHEVALILQHEAEHVRARDPWLLAAATVVVVAMPWNLPLIWQALRLRRAIELDCDARVLARGAARRTYADLLVRLAVDIPPFPFAFAALSERRSFLRDRLEAMRGGANPMGGYTRVALVVAITAGLVGIFAFAPRFATVQVRSDGLGRLERLERFKIDQAVQRELEESLVRLKESTRNIEEARGTVSEISDADLLELRDRLAAQVDRVRAEGAALERQALVALRVREDIESRLRNVEERIAGEGGAAGGPKETLPAGAVRLRQPDLPDISADRNAVAGMLDPPLENGPIVVVDGERITWAELKALDRDRIDRIEVIKGDAARATYGPDARNGVIQIYLKN